MLTNALQRMQQKGINACDLYHFYVKKKANKKNSQLNLKTCCRKNIHDNPDRDMLEMSSSFLFSSHKTRPRIIQPLNILFLIKSKRLLSSWVKSLIVTCATLKDRSSAVAPRDSFKRVRNKNKTKQKKGSSEPHCNATVLSLYASSARGVCMYPSMPQIQHSADCCKPCLRTITVCKTTLSLVILKHRDVCLIVLTYDEAFVFQSKKKKPLRFTLKFC